MTIKSVNSFRLFSLTFLLAATFATSGWNMQVEPDPNLPRNPRMININITATMAAHSYHDDARLKIFTNNKNVVSKELFNNIMSEYNVVLQVWHGIVFSPDNLSPELQLGHNEFESLGDGAGAYFWSAYSELKRRLAKLAMLSMSKFINAKLTPSTVFTDTNTNDRHRLKINFLMYFKQYMSEKAKANVFLETYLQNDYAFVDAVGGRRGGFFHIKGYASDNRIRHHRLSVELRKALMASSVAQGISVEQLLSQNLGALLQDRGIDAVLEGCPDLLARLRVVYRKYLLYKFMNEGSVELAKQVSMPGPLLGQAVLREHNLRTARNPVNITPAATRTPVVVAPVTPTLATNSSPVEQQKTVATPEPTAKGGKKPSRSSRKKRNKKAVALPQTFDVPNMPGVQDAIKAAQVTDFSPMPNPVTPADVVDEKPAKKVSLVGKITQKVHGKIKDRKAKEPQSTHKNSDAKMRENSRTALTVAAPASQERQVYRSISPVVAELTHAPTNTNFIRSGVENLSNFGKLWNRAEDFASRLKQTYSYDHQLNPTLLNVNKSYLASLHLDDNHNLQLLEQEIKNMELQEKRLQEEAKLVSLAEKKTQTLSLTRNKLDISKISEHQLVDDSGNLRTGFLEWVTEEQARALPYPYAFLRRTPQEIFQALDTLKGAQHRIVRNARARIYNTDEPIPCSVMTISREENEAMNFISDVFMERVSRHCSRPEADGSPYELWNQLKDKIIDETPREEKLDDTYYSIEYLEKEFRRSHINAKGVFPFKPSILAHYIKKYGIKSVLDISSGWGDRLLACIAHMIRYLGVDPNSKLVEIYQEMIDALGGDNKHLFTMISSPFETAKLPDEKFDMVLTSPPYFTLEKFSDEESQSVNKFSELESWKRDFLYESLYKAWQHLNDNGHLILSINDCRDQRYVMHMKHIVDTFPGAKFKGVTVQVSETSFRESAAPKGEPLWHWVKKPVDRNKAVSSKKLYRSVFNDYLNLVSSVSKHSIKKSPIRNHTNVVGFCRDGMKGGKQSCKAMLDVAALKQLNLTVVTDPDYQLNETPTVQLIKAGGNIRNYARAYAAKENSLFIDVDSAEFSALLDFTLKNNLSPILAIKEYEVKPGLAVKVIRDDKLIGGTKQRALARYLQLFADDHQEFLYAGPSTGYAQVALSHVCDLFGWKARLFLQGAQTELTNFSTNSHAAVHFYDKTLKQLNDKALRYVEKDVTNGSMLLPFGFDDDKFSAILEDEIRKSLPAEFSPKRLWVAVGSGALLRVLAKVLPESEIMPVQTGIRVREKHYAPEVWKRMGGESNVAKLRAPQKFTTAVSGDDLPPYKSVATYDAKIWQHLSSHAKNGDYVWNVGRDIVSY